jgi:hypothetical protein
LAQSFERGWLGQTGHLAVESQSVLPERLSADKSEKAFESVMGVISSSEMRE